MMSKKEVVFNGRLYTRSENGRYYFEHTTKNSARENARQLHRAVWEFYNGPIPEGYQIHHKDHDVDNNDISNLECVSRKEHLSHHAYLNSQNEEYVKKREETLHQNRAKAAEWHRSTDGKEWHRNHAKESIGLVKRCGKSCTFCGKEYEALPWQEYCCQSCAEKARRRRIGLKFDGSQRNCKFCGEWYSPRIHNQIFCSTRCKQSFYRKQK